MKLIVKILTALALVILFTGSAQAAELQVDSRKILVAQSNIVPRRHQRFIPPINVPHRPTARKDYATRLPARPIPRYVPSKPQPSYDNRGGKRKNFGPPQAPRR